MKRFIIFLSALTIQTNISLAQSQWTEWIPVHPAIQVSFKHAQKESDYSFVRFKSVSPQEFCAARVEFEIHEDGVYKIIGFESGRLKPMSIVQSDGSYFHTSKKAAKIRLTKLWDSECNDILNGSIKNNGVNEIYFPKKQQTTQEAKQEAENEETERRLKAWQEQEKRKQEDIKKQNAAAAKIREQQATKQQELELQRNKQQEETKKRYKEQEEATKKSGKEISNSINEAGDIILKGIKDAENEREERKRKVQAEAEKNRANSSPEIENGKSSNNQQTEKHEIEPNLLTKEELESYITHISPGRSNTTLNDKEGILSFVEVGDGYNLKIEILLGNIDVNSFSFVDNFADKGNITFKGNSKKTVLRLKNLLTNEYEPDNDKDGWIFFSNSLILKLPNRLLGLVDIEFTLKYYAIKYQNKTY